jgi:hypothetical protein
MFSRGAWAMPAILKRRGYQLKKSGGRIRTAK